MEKDKLKEWKCQNQDWGREGRILHKTDLKGKKNDKKSPHREGQGREALLEHCNGNEEEVAPMNAFCL